MYAALKAVHFISLCLLLGGPVFWFLMWEPALRALSSLSAKVDESVTRLIRDRLRVGMWLGMVLFVASGLGDVLRAASNIFDLRNLALVQVFVLQTRIGQMGLTKAGLALAFVVVFPLSLRVAGYRGRGAERTARWPKRVWLTLVGLVGLGILFAISFTSHGAAKPGLYPLISDVIHLIGIVLWAGGLLYLALVPWRLLVAGTPQPGLMAQHVLERFSNMAMIAVVAIVATGIIAAYLHIHGLVALTGTPYGQALFLKVVLFVMVIGIAAFNLLVVSPAFGQLDPNTSAYQSVMRRLFGWLSMLVRTEALLLLAVLTMAGVLTTLPPADTPGRVASESWEQVADGYRVQMTMEPIGPAGQVRVHVAITEPDGYPPPENTRVYVHLNMREHYMGTFPVEAEQTAAGRYVAEARISMAGSWHLEVIIVPPDGPEVMTGVDLTAAKVAAVAGPQNGLERRLVLAAAWASPARFSGFMVGLLLIGLAVFSVYSSKAGKLPSWGVPLGLFLLTVGGVQILSLVLVYAYPTTYKRNPVPYTTESVTVGRNLFVANCAACHGLEGRGNGPASVGLNPPPADLTAEHVDLHTDGDLFWWISEGMDGSAMPGFSQVLSEKERWDVINYVRSLRRAPPRERGR